MTGAGLTGRSGEDVYIKVPLGTIISERFPDEEDDEEDMVCYIFFIIIVFESLGPDMCDCYSVHISNAFSVLPNPYLSPIFFTVYVR